MKYYSDRECSSLVSSKRAEIYLGGRGADLSSKAPGKYEKKRVVESGADHIRITIIALRRGLCVPNTHN